MTSIVLSLSQVIVVISKITIHMNSTEETTAVSGDGSDTEITEIEVELPNLLFSVLERIEQLLGNMDGWINSNSMLCQITVLDQVVSFLRAVAEDDETQQTYLVTFGWNFLRIINHH